MLRSFLCAGVLFAAQVFGQTFTDCDPRQKDCAPNPALGTTYNKTWDKGSTELGAQLWNVTEGSSLITFGNSGADLTLVQSGQSVTAQSKFYIMWGTVEILFRAAAGQGIISTVVLLSDDLDEIDVEIKGGNHTHFSTNYYGHGNLSQGFAKDYALQGPQDDFHNYTIVWGQDKIDWLINGQQVRTVGYAPSGLYPQTPAMIKFGIWAAGDMKDAPGTVEWAGGKTDWKQGPFVMSIKSIRVTDGHTNVTTYQYGDRSGDWQSIIANPGVSKAYEAMHKKSAAQKTAENWRNMSTGAKIGIACGVVGVLAICTIAFCIFCFRQRKQGRAEREAADQAWNEQQQELMSYRQRMAKGGFAIQGPTYHGEKF